VTICTTTETVVVTVSAARVAVMVSVAVAAPAAVIVTVSGGATEGQVEETPEVERALTAVAVDEVSEVAVAVPFVRPSDVRGW
jgi:hypothetical protein